MSWTVLGLEKNFQHREFQKGLSLLRAESRDNEGVGYPRGDVVRAVGWLKGEPTFFVGL